MNHSSTIKNGRDGQKKRSDLTFRAALCVGPSSGLYSIADSVRHRQNLHSRSDTPPVDPSP